MMLMFQALVSGVLTSVMAACAMPWQPAISPLRPRPTSSSAMLGSSAPSAISR